MPYSGVESAVPVRREVTAKQNTTKGQWVVHPKALRWQSQSTIPERKNEQPRVNYAEIRTYLILV